MAIILWLAVGAALAVASKWMMPGPNPLGTAGLIVVGMIGAILGGFAGMALSGNGLNSIEVSTLFTAFSGGVAAVFCYRTYALRDEASVHPVSHPEMVEGKFLAPHTPS